MSPLHVVVVTGLSGAGKTTAVNALEDLGYYSVDNLPIVVLGQTLAELRRAGEAKVALGLDVRMGEASIALAAPILENLKKDSGIALTVLYLDSSEELLIRRFSATRRPHPLVRQGKVDKGALYDGIELERRLLSDLRGQSELVIDTTNMSVHELRREIIHRFGKGADAGLHTRVVSFGFKFGPPHDADLVLDVRFLPNPYFMPALRDLSGLDEPVWSYVKNHSDTAQFISLTVPLLRFCLNRFEAEGKSFATVAIGCTGGRHRSVALAEHFVQELRGDLGKGSIEVVHRDIRNAEHTAASVSQQLSEPSLGSSQKSEGSTRHE